MTTHHEFALTFDPAPRVWLDGKRVRVGFFAAAILTPVLVWLDWRRGSGLPGMKR